MKRTYCKNCKYNGRLVCKHFKHLKDPFTGDPNELSSTDVLEKYKGLNVNGQCPHYELKWWKKLLSRIK